MRIIVLFNLKEGVDPAAYEAWATAPDRTFAERAFVQRAGHWARDDATLLSAATTLGLSAADVDELFELAATL